uniref:Uncharacterized protein n=1 Tax=Anguilla anguilla TaxID=7936 RepID=A0A0E9VS31_ANGAN
MFTKVNRAATQKDHHKVFIEAQKHTFITCAQKNTY